MKHFINTLFSFIIVPVLWVYERYFMYRIRDSWGCVHLYNIKNKGKNNEIVGYSRFLDSNNMLLGSNISIGYNCFFFCKGGISIDDYTIISRNVTIYSANHNYRSDSIPYDDLYVSKPVKIGKAVWIGMNVCILPGVTIGDGAIVGMGAVVSRDVAPGEIVGTAPTRLIGGRDMSNFARALRDGDIYALRYAGGHANGGKPEKGVV